MLDVPFVDDTSFVVGGGAEKSDMLNLVRGGREVVQDS